MGNWQGVYNKVFAEINIVSTIVSTIGSIFLHEVKSVDTEKILGL